MLLQIKKRNTPSYIAETRKSSTSQKSPQPIQHARLVFRRRVRLRHRIHHAHRRQTPRHRAHAVLRRQPIAPARPHIRRRRRVRSEHARQHEPEVPLAAAVHAVRAREVHVQRDVAREHWIGEVGEEAEGRDERGDEAHAERGVDLGCGGEVRGCCERGERDLGACERGEGDGGDAFFSSFACCTAEDISHLNIVVSNFDFNALTQAAYTVPELMVTLPRFVPTLGPDTTKSGRAPLKNFGAIVWIPNRTLVTLVDVHQRLNGPSFKSFNVRK